MFRQVTKIVHQFKYTRKAYFNNGREPLIEELIIDSDVPLPGFKKRLEEWNRKGQAMKGIPSKSHVQGYDYWMTDEQLEYNQTVNYQRINCLEYAG